MQGNPPPTSLDTLPAELFNSVAARLPLSALGHLGCASRHCAGLLSAATEAWKAAWAALTCDSQRPPDLPVREAVRCLTTLESLRWEHLPATALPPAAPRWREHSCVLSCNGGRRLVLFGGRDPNHQVYFNDTWTCDLRTGEWTRVARHGPAPSPRCFNADAGGGRVLRGPQDQGVQEEWALIFCGLCQTGHRLSQTWLLGPLNEPPERWHWLPTTPDGEMGRPPVARFHHTLTVVPGRPPAPSCEDTLVMLGGHDRTVTPILSTHVLLLGLGSFEWGGDDEAKRPEETGEDGMRRRAATLTWCAQPRDPEPSPRGFHAACHWHDPRDEWSDFVILSCGLGAADDEERAGEAQLRNYQPLGDTWLFDLCASSWLRLPARLPARSRPALAVARDRLILAGGCRAAGSAEPNPLAPGEAFDDVWLLDLKRAVGPACAASHQRTAREGVAWERCLLPSHRVHRAPHANATALALHGGAVVLILGGHDPRKRMTISADHFGDMNGSQAWALHETEAVAVGEKPTRPQARLCVDGMPHFHDHCDEAVETRDACWKAFRGKRVLLHSLEGQRELNGAVGTITLEHPEGDCGPDTRVGVELGPPHSRSVAVRKRNLQVSRCTARGDTPAIVQPSCADEDGCVWALTPAMGFAQLSAARRTRPPEEDLELRNGIAVSRLQLLP